MKGKVREGRAGGVFRRMSMGLYIGYSTYQKQILHQSPSLPPPPHPFFSISRLPPAQTPSLPPPSISPPFSSLPLPPHPSFLYTPAPPHLTFPFPFLLPPTPFSQIDLSRLLSWLANFFRRLKELWEWMFR